MAYAYIYIPRLNLHEYISVNEIENFDVSQFDKDITRKLTFSWRLEGTTENVQILSIISSEQLQKINRQVRVPLIKLSKTLIEKHQRNIAAGQINDANSQRPEKDSQVIVGRECLGTIQDTRAAYE
ncbi:PREDICTED: uncharacterized protein LOC105450669 [Wasmannia auropunctata]|uniref:uncharacterized protein LOC105450669 n=1 Tax=Wasmannia auropunctata TaxID=64793 RepID=UPI0005F010A3|nr:PREDICTED: uncharacterized protein LOC105450669 [Wasmannia auropunctata]